jgi:hypothetical protein
MTAPARTLIGTKSGTSSRVKVFLTPEAVEVEDVEGYDVTCRRVFFDEVLLVTYHRTYGWAFIVTMALLASFFGLIVLLTALNSLYVALVLFSFMVLPFLVLIGLRLAYQLDVITVYGKRSRAQVQFWLRKRRAREVHQRICRLVREGQARLQREIAASAPAAAPAPPPPA